MKEKHFCSFLCHNKNDNDAEFQDYDGIFRYSCEALAHTDEEEDTEDKKRRRKSRWEKASSASVYVSRRWLDDLPDPNGNDMYGHPIWDETQDGSDLYSLLEKAVKSAKSKNKDDDNFALGEESMGHDLIIFEQLKTRLKHRRRGAARFLVDFAIRSFVSPSTTSLAVCLVRKDNKRALEVWRQLKFTWKLGENDTVVLLGRPLMYQA